MTQPKVSALFTVYNKAGFLARTIASVHRQLPDEAEIEYVFADDASTDNSVEIIRELVGDAPNVQILTNDVNQGPSVRLNQAAYAAQGKYLYFLDADDLAAPGAISGMLDLLAREDADLIYGKTEKPPLAAGMEPPKVPENSPYAVSDEPLETILSGGFVRMALMCRRDLYLSAGGADERIFVQDESLPLRLGMHARRLIDWRAKIVFRQPNPEGATHLSSNLNQQQHDAFLAAALALEILPEHCERYAGKLYARAVSQYWKVRKRQGALPLISSDFWRYQLTRGGAKPDRQAIGLMVKRLSKLENVRRMV